MEEGLAKPTKPTLYGLDFALKWQRFAYDNGCVDVCLPWCSCTRGHPDSLLICI